MQIRSEQLGVHDTTPGANVDVRSTGRSPNRDAVTSPKSGLLGSHPGSQPVWP
ncbi:MAG: hypothetical protein ACXW0T_07765 [Methylobacter sp.]